LHCSKIAIHDFVKKQIKKSNLLLCESRALYCCILKVVRLLFFFLSHYFHFEIGNLFVLLCIVW